MCYRISWYAFRILFRTVFSWRVYHPERIPASGPVILASNHASYIDPPLVAAACVRPVVFLARESLFNNPLAGRFLRWVDAVPLDRDGTTSKGLKTAVDSLKRGRVILVFPEGTRTQDGQLQRMQAGVPMLALKTGAVLVPVRIFGAYEALNRNSILLKPTRLSVVFGHPVPLDDLKTRKDGENMGRKETYNRAADRLYHAIQGLSPGRQVTRFPEQP